MQLVVREATRQDMASILDLMQEAFAHDRAGPPRPVLGRGVGQVRGELRTQPKGLVHRERKLAWVDEIVVAKTSRQESVGRKLMQRVADWAREREAEAVSLEVYAFNDSARAFYASLGFEPLRLRLEQGL